MKAVCLIVASLLAGQSAPVREPQSSPASVADLTVMLVLDVSWSVSQQSLRLDDRFVRIFNAFVQKLQPADRGAIGILANKLQVSSLTSDTRQLSASVRGLLQVADGDRLGPTPIWDALDDAVTMVSPGTGRRAIILYSDGRSTGNVHSLAEIIDHATRAGIAIHVVIPPERFTVDRLNPSDLLDRLASATGGRRWMELRLPGSAAGLVGQIMDMLHTGR